MEHSGILAALEQEDGDLTEIEVDEVSAKVEIVCKIYKNVQLGSILFCSTNIHLCLIPTFDAL